MFKLEVSMENTLNLRVVSSMFLTKEESAFLKYNWFMTCSMVSKVIYF